MSITLTPAGLSASYHDGLDASVIVTSNKNAHTTVLLHITSCLCVLLTTMWLNLHNSRTVSYIKVLIAVVCGYDSIYKFVFCMNHM